MIFDIIILALSLTFLACFFLTFIRAIKNLSNSDDAIKILRAVFVLLAGTFVFFGTTRIGALDDIYRFLGSFYSAAKLFLVDGTLTFENIRSNMAPTLKYMYFGTYYLTALLAVCISAYTVLSFFKNFSANIKLQFYSRYKDICIFNELNVKSLSAAYELKNEHQPSGENTKKEYDFFTVRPKGSPLIVFCDVFEQNNEISHELISEAEALGALCFKKNVVEVHKQLHKIRAYRFSDKHLLRYYLFGQNDKENVRHAIDISDIEDAAKVGYKNLGIFVSAFGDANGIMVNSINLQNQRYNEKKGYFVRRLNPALMMAYNVISAEENLLVDASSPDKDLNVLVVGMGRYGFEIIKALTWFYQRKSGKITIHIVDKDPSIKSFANATCPELVNHTLTEDPFEDSQFSLVFHGGYDVFSEEFKTLLDTEEFNTLDAVFTTLGDDNINAEAALYIRTLLDRIHYKEIYAAETDKDKKSDYICFANNGIIDYTKIFAVIHNDENDMSLNSDSSFSSGNYNISFVGMDSKLYTCKNIYDFEIENTSTQKHGKNFGIEEANMVINSYNTNEQHRISSIADTIHRKFISKLYPDCDFETLSKIANKRWNAFMRSAGFIKVDNEMTKEERAKLFALERGSVRRRFNRGKWHNSIAQFSQLSKEEQDNILKSTKNKN